MAKPTPKPNDSEFASLFRAGTSFFVQSSHPDCVDLVEFRVAKDGGGEVDCITPGLPESFRASFTEQALARGDALLAVTQTNPNARQGDEEGFVEREGRRFYTFRQTTPPFLLSDALGRVVRERRPMELYFYDFLRHGAPLSLAFAKEVTRQISVNGKMRSVPVVRYEGSDEYDAVLEVEPQSKLVLLVSRDDGEFEMRLEKIQQGK